MVSELFKLSFSCREAAHEASCAGGLEPGTDASAFDANDEANEVTVTGRVVDPQGDPISDATIVHSFDDQEIRENVEFTTTSDETGRFELRIQNHGSADAILLWAFGSGHSIRAATHWLGQENEITLSEMEAIEITITESDGTPVANARVTPRSHPVPTSIHPRGIFTRQKSPMCPYSFQRQSRPNWP